MNVTFSKKRLFHFSGISLTTFFIRRIFAGCFVTDSILLFTIHSYYLFMILKNVYTCQVSRETYVLEHFLEFIGYINSLITDVSLLQDIQYKVKAVYAKNMKLH